MGTLSVILAPWERIEERGCLPAYDLLLPAFPVLPCRHFVSALLHHLLMSVGRSSLAAIS